jgi:hypothetical protein
MEGYFPSSRTISNLVAWVFSFLKIRRGAFTSLGFLYGAFFQQPTDCCFNVGAFCL